MTVSANEYKHLWARVVERTPSDCFVRESILEKASIVSVDKDVITVAVNSNVAMRALSEGDVHDSVLRAIVDVFESDYKLRAVMETDVKTETTSARETPAFFSDSALNDKYRFNTFVEGPSNREAYQAALFVASHVGKMFNPLLIYGGSGLGKTHLLHAIGNAIRDANPAQRVLCLHTQEFLNEYIKYVSSDRKGGSIVDWFKNHVDVLLVDDVQFLAKKEKTEETFFSIYDSFYRAGKQIVITSDLHPSLLNGLDERLKSRFVQGLPLCVDAPEKETCEKILRLKIELNGLPPDFLDDEAVSYFASKYRSSVRELEGALYRLIFFATSVKPVSKVDLKYAREAVGELPSASSDGSTMTTDAIIEIVADYYNLGGSQLRSKIRTGQISLARHVAMYLARETLGVPLQKIGDAFGGRDHATVINGVNRVEKMLKTDQGLNDSVSALRKRIKA